MNSKKLHQKLLEAGLSLLQESGQTFLGVGVHAGSGLHGGLFLQQLLDGHAQIICDLLWKISLFRGILPLSNTKEIL